MHDYRERLYVPVAWWLLGIPTVLIFGATLYAGLSGPWPTIVVVVFLAGLAVLLPVKPGQGLHRPARPESITNLLRSRLCPNAPIRPAVPTCCARSFVTPTPANLSEQADPPAG